MNNENAVSEFLEHYGVKGMRWGVRRSQAQLDRAAGRKEEKTKKQEEVKKQAKAKQDAQQKYEQDLYEWKKKKHEQDLKEWENKRRSDGSGKRSVDSLSDKELKDVVNRMNLEKQYASLQPTTFGQKSTKFLGEVALNITRTQLTNLGNQQANKVIGQFMESRSKIPKAPKTNTTKPLMKISDIYKSPDASKRVG